MILCVSKFQKNGQNCGFHWTSKSQNCFSFRGLCPPIPWQGALLLDPIGGKASKPPLQTHASHAHHGLPIYQILNMRLKTCLSLILRLTCGMQCYVLLVCYFLQVSKKFLTQMNIEHLQARCIKIHLSTCTAQCTYKTARWLNNTDKKQLHKCTYHRTFKPCKKIFVINQPKKCQWPRSPQSLTVI